MEGSVPATRCEVQHLKEAELLSVLKRCCHRLRRTNMKAREWTLRIMRAVQVLSEDEGKERLEASKKTLKAKKVGENTY